MPFPYTVIDTQPVLGLFFGDAFDTIIELKLKAVDEEPRSKPTENMAATFKAEPTTLFDCIDDNETQNVTAKLVLPELALGVFPVSPKPFPAKVTETLPLVGAFKTMDLWACTDGAL